MTETSLPWNGTATGDAASAPYDHLEFSRMFNKILASDGAGYVAPGYANNLNVQASSPAAASVDVATGAAYVKGFLYENDALATLPIAANASGNPRIDRIVLRVDFTAQTVRLVVLQGNPAAAPAIPALTQTYGTIWEISLAYVWVANGFASIVDTEIFDERQFLETAFNVNIADRANNLIRNSEFLGWGGGAPASNLPPPWGWDAAAGGTFSHQTKPAQMVRGRAIGSNRAISQTFEVRPSTTYVLKGLLYAVTTTAGVTVTTDSGAPQTITKTIRQTGAWKEVQLVYTTEADATTMTLSFSSTSIRIGQWLCTLGYIPGPFRVFHEIVDAYVPTGYADGVYDAAWDDDQKSSGTTTIDLDTSFQGHILSGVQAVKLEVRFADTASAAAALAKIDIGGGHIILSVAGIVNDIDNFGAGWTGLRADSPRDFDVSISATGVLTATASLKIIGVRT